MATDHDSVVQELFEQLKKKKAEVAAGTEKPVWQTNCSFGTSDSSADNRTNIQVVTDPDTIVKHLAFLYYRQDNYERAAKDLGISSKFNWMGFTVDQWKHDFKTRIDKIKVTERKKELDILEDRLNKLVSPEMRQQLEIEAIKKELGV